MNKQLKPGWFGGEANKRRKSVADVQCSGLNQKNVLEDLHPWVEFTRLGSKHALYDDLIQTIPL
jgi:hypothetical protein